MIHNFNLMNLIYIKNSFKKLKIYMIEKNKPLPNLLKLAQAVVQNMWFFKILSGFKLVVNCVGCVCRHSSHVRTFLSNSRHKLQVAAFPRLAAAFRGSNTRVYVIAISFTMCEKYRTTHLHQVLFYNGGKKPQLGKYQLLQQAYGEDAVGCTQVFSWLGRFGLHAPCILYIGQTYRFKDSVRTAL